MYAGNVEHSTIKMEFAESSNQLAGVGCGVWFSHRRNFFLHNHSKDDLDSQSSQSRLSATTKRDVWLCHIGREVAGFNVDMTYRALNKYNS